MSPDIRSDRPALDPHLVSTQGFSTSFRGYDTGEVRAYLEALSGLLQNAADREADLLERLEDAERRASAPPVFNDQQFTAVLGEETTRVLETAQQAAASIKSKSEDNAGRLVREANEEATSTRAAADEYATEVRTAADEHATRVKAEADEQAGTARSAADVYATKARADADREVTAQRTAAEEYAARTRHDAESILAERTAEAEVAAAEIQAETDRAKADAEAEIEAVRQAASTELDELRARVATETAAEIESARQEGRGMVAEARAVRSRMLTDLAERRKAGRAQLDLLRAARQQLVGALESMRARIDETASDLATTVVEARTATDEATRRDEADDAILTAMMADETATTPDAGPGTGSADAPTEVVVDVTEAVADAGDGPPDDRGTSSGGSGTGRSSTPTAEMRDVGDQPTRRSGNDPSSAASMASSSRATVAEASRTEPATDEPNRTRIDLRAGDVRGRDATTALLERRDAATAKTERQLARRLKRLLSDEQNEMLDQVRRARGTPTAATAMPDESAHAGRYASVAVGDLAGAAAAGARFYGGSARSVVTQVDDLADQLAGELVRQLRGRLQRCFDESQGDEAELGERIRACYREWKSQRITETSRHFVLAAFTRGLFDAAPYGTAFQWIVDDGGTPCPDAEDNALGGEIPKGEPFPTGDAYPPAHAGCRCLIVPAGF